MELTTDEALQQGIAAHRAGKLEDAEKLYKAILTSHPKHPDANHNLGILAVGVGKLDESVPYFKTALEASPNVEQFWFSYIDTLIKLGHLDGARQVIQQGRGVGLKGAKIDGLEARLGSSLPSSSDPSKDQLDGFVSLYQQGKYEEALVRGKALSEQFPSNAFIPNILGAVHAALGDNEAAVSSYNKAIEIKPDYAEPYNNLGTAFIKTKQYKEAIFRFRKAIILNPGYALAYSNKGISLNELTMYEDALVVFSRALIFNPENTTICQDLGNILQILCDYENAASYYGMIDSPSAEAMSMECLYKAGKIDQLFEKLDAYSNQTKVNIRIAALSSFAAHQLKRDDYPFCRSPLDFLQITHSSAFSAN